LQCTAGNIRAKLGKQKKHGRKAFSCRVFDKTF
jgi:hypothetical protein